jgi:fructoselysine-6-P-deglycase FrlB-like protein
MKLPLILLTAISLAGCMITSKAGDLITIKPNQAQISAAAKRIVCDSFAPITFSAKGDTPETVAQIRRNNARRASFGCK